MFGKLSKYKNKKTLANGILFDSKKEANQYLKYKKLLDNGLIAKLELQVPLIYDIQYVANDKIYTTKGKYIADFVVTYHSGEVEYIDVKGFRTPEYKRKKKIIKKLYNIDIIEI